MISPHALIAGFQKALDEKWGYIYGKTYELWSAAKQAAYAKDFADDPDRKLSVEYGGQWAGHYVTDCSGLFAKVFQDNGGRMYHGSNTMLDSWCVAKGKLAGGKRTDGQELLPGTAVFTEKGARHNHVGLYIGGGLVIEAAGARDGVITSKITNKKWKCWGELRGVNYARKADDDDGKKEGSVMFATVSGGNMGLPINMRAGKSASTALVEQIPQGSTVTVIDTGDEWMRCQYNGHTGYIKAEFVHPESGGDEPDAVVVRLTLSQAEALLPILDSAKDQIIAAVGRG